MSYQKYELFDYAKDFIFSTDRELGLDLDFYETIFTEEELDHLEEEREVYWDLMEEMDWFEQQRFQARVELNFYHQSRFYINFDLFKSNLFLDAFYDNFIYRQPPVSVASK